jgi:hypothetical protein
LRTRASGPEQVKRFGENGDRRGEWLIDYGRATENYG